MKIQKAKNMIKKLTLITLALLSFASMNVKAQLAADTIITKKLSSGGLHYYHGDVRLGNGELIKLLKSNAASVKDIKSARANNAFGTILGISGGALIGLPIGTYIGGGKPNWALVGVGTVFAIASVPLHIQAKKQTKKSILNFNEAVSNKTSFLDRSELLIAPCENGIGLVWRF